MLISGLYKSISKSFSSILSPISDSDEPFQKILDQCDDNGWIQELSLQVKSHATTLADSNSFKQITISKRATYVYKFMPVFGTGLISVPISAADSSNVIVATGLGVRSFQLIDCVSSDTSIRASAALEYYFLDMADIMANHKFILNYGFGTYETDILSDKKIVHESDQCMLFTYLENLEDGFGTSLVQSVIVDVVVPDGFTERPCWKSIAPLFEQQIDELWRPLDNDMKFLKKHHIFFESAPKQSPSREIALNSSVYSAKKQAIKVAEIVQAVSKFIMKIEMLENFYHVPMRENYAKIGLTSAYALVHVIAPVVLLIEAHRKLLAAIQVSNTAENLSKAFVNHVVLLTDGFIKYLEAQDGFQDPKPALSKFVRLCEAKCRSSNELNKDSDISFKGLRNNVHSFLVNYLLLFTALCEVSDQKNESYAVIKSALEAAQKLNSDINESLKLKNDAKLRRNIDNLIDAKGQILSSTAVYICDIEVTEEIIKSSSKTKKVISNECVFMLFSTFFVVVAVPHDKKNKVVFQYRKSLKDMVLLDMKDNKFILRNSDHESYYFTAKNLHEKTIALRKVRHAILMENSLRHVGEVELPSKMLFGQKYGATDIYYRILDTPETRKLQDISLSDVVFLLYQSKDDITDMVAKYNSKLNVLVPILVGDDGTFRRAYRVQQTKYWNQSINPMFSKAINPNTNSVTFETLKDELLKLLRNSAHLKLSHPSFYRQSDVKMLSTQLNEIIYQLYVDRDKAGHGRIMSVASLVASLASSVKSFKQKLEYKMNSPNKSSRRIGGINMLQRVQSRIFKKPSSNSIETQILQLLNYVAGLKEDRLPTPNLYKQLHWELFALKNLNCSSYDVPTIFQVVLSALKETSDLFLDDVKKQSNLSNDLEFVQHMRSQILPHMKPVQRTNFGMVVKLVRKLLSMENSWMPTNAIKLETFSYLLQYTNRSIVESSKSGSKDVEWWTLELGIEAMECIWFNYDSIFCLEDQARHSLDETKSMISSALGNRITDSTAKATEVMIESIIPPIYPIQNPQEQPPSILVIAKELSFEAIQAALLSLLDDERDSTKKIHPYSIVSSEKTLSNLGDSLIALMNIPTS